MKINEKYSPAFYGRKLTMSQVREMKSRVESTFPYTSSWKLSHIDYYNILKKHNYPNSKLSIDTICKMNEEIRVLNDLARNTSIKLRMLRDEYTQFVRYPLEYFKKLASGVLKYKSANCGEVAKLMYMAARINDVDEKDVQISKLAYRTNQIADSGFEPPFEEIDHAILTMNTVDEEIGMDEIIETTGILEELKADYAEKYGKALGIPKGAEVGFLPVDTKNYSARSMPRLNDNELEELRDMYPNLIV